MKKVTGFPLSLITVTITSVYSNAVPTQKISMATAFPRVPAPLHLWSDMIGLESFDDSTRVVPLMRSSFGDSSFGVAGPRVWNGLTTRHQLKRLLKPSAFVS